MSKDLIPKEIHAVGQPSCEELSAEVEAAKAAKALIDAFAKEQMDGIHFCPRCGRFSVKDRIHTNALSRYIDVYICDECGLDEAVRAMVDEPLPLREWAVAKIGGSKNE